MKSMYFPPNSEFSIIFFSWNFYKKKQLKPTAFDTASRVYFPDTFVGYCQKKRKRKLALSCKRSYFSSQEIGIDLRRYLDLIKSRPPSIYTSGSRRHQLLFSSYKCRSEKE